MKRSFGGDERSQLSGVRLAACSFFVFAPIGIQMPFFSLWLSSRGFDATLIALLLGIAPLVRFTANLLLPPRADRSGGAVPLLLLCTFGTAAAQAASAAPFGLAWIFVVSLVATAGQGPSIPLLDSIILGEVRRRIGSGERPLDYGKIRASGSASVLILMIGSGALASQIPATAIIWLIAGSSLAAALAVAFLLPSVSLPRPVIDEARVRGARRTGRIVLVIGSSALVQASHAAVYAFGSLGWRRDGYSDGEIGALWAVGVGTEVLLFLLARRLGGGRASPSIYLTVGAGTAVVRWLVMAASPGSTTLAIAQALHAGSFAATYFGAVLGLASLGGETRRAQVQGWLAAANALTLASATIACGPLWSSFGHRVYFLMAGLASAGLIGAGVLAAGERIGQPQRAGSGGQTSDPS